MFKKILQGFLLLLLLLIIIYWEMISYGLTQARGQLKIIRQSRPTDEVLADPVIPDSIKVKIRLIQHVKDYAFSEIGLKKSANYSTYYDQGGEVLLWNLSAAKPFALEPKEWHFPILGSFPYKGFFQLEKAEEELERLKDEGYDVQLRPVGGWSTLGWTKDPILSNMLERPTGAMVELIFHELTHSTVFIKDDIQFNENLASFIGEKATVQYLKQTFGRDSEELIEYILNEEDHANFRNLMLEGARKLDALYKSFAQNERSDSSKNSLKHILIDEIASAMDTLHFHSSRYEAIFDQHRPNNAYFMSFQRYYDAGDSLEHILQEEYRGNLKAFVHGMKNLYN